MLSIANRSSSIVCPAIETLSETLVPAGISGNVNIATIFWVPEFIKVMLIFDMSVGYPLLISSFKG